MLDNAPDWHNPFSRDKVIPALGSIALIALFCYSPQESPQERNPSEQKPDTTYIKTPDVLNSNRENLDATNVRNVPTLPELMEKN